MNRATVILAGALAAGLAAADPGQQAAFLATGRRAPGPAAVHDLGVRFDTDRGAFAFAVPTAFAGPRLVSGIERSCSCLQVAASGPGGDAAVPPGAAIAIAGEIALPPLPGRYQTELVLHLAAPPGGDGARDDLPVRLAYEVRASLTCEPELPAVLFLDHDRPATLEVACRLHRPVRALTVSLAGVPGYHAEVADGRLRIAGPPPGYGERSLRLRFELDGRTLLRDLRLVGKHRLLPAASFPAGLVGETGEVRLPLAAAATAEVPAGSAPPGRLSGLRLRREADAAVLSFAVGGPPGPFDDRISIRLAGEEVPIRIFGVRE